MATTERPAHVTLLPGATKDKASVSPAGTRLVDEVVGVTFRPSPVQADDRGTLQEVFSDAWEISATAARYVYEMTLRPGQVRGWSVHERQTDRLFFSSGCAKASLYDARAGSPTEGLVDVRYLGAHAPGLLVVPPGVYHAVRNVGNDDLRILNLPDPPYDHDAPDKYRLSADSPAIPHIP